MRPWLRATCLCLSLLASMPFGGGPVRAQDEPARVLATIGMIGDVADNIGGECVAVTRLMGPGIDPHLYRARARDVQSFQAAEAILYSGHFLEGQLGDVLARFKAMKPTLAVAEQAVDSDELIQVAGSGTVDPHLWMDPGLWARIVPVIAGQLAELRPACTERIEAAAADYGDQLAALDQWAREAIASIPPRQRVLVTAHDAFAYFGRAYGIEVEGIQGISTEAEAAIADIRQVVDLVVTRQIPAIFVESTISARTVEAVIAAARERGHEVVIGGQLYSDAMGEDGTPGGTYIGMIHANTTSIVTALGGVLPDLPKQLKPWAEAWDVAIR